MRVTNEQALAVKNMVNGRPDIYANGTNIPADWFAIDILEARAVIEKRTELIKEMREVLVSARNDGLSYDVVVNEVVPMIERTKEYV